MKKKVDGKLKQKQKTSQPVAEWTGPYLEFRQVSKIYQMGDVEIRALNKTSFTIDQGELVVILGQSGAGKTTALNILGGMDRVTSGNFRMEGQEITTLKERELIRYRREKIGFVFQFYNLIQNLTALENVELAVQLCKDYLDPQTALEQVGLGDRKNNFPSQLSGGEQQRVAIARALINSPAVLLADEPSGNLDSHNRDEIHRLFFELRERLGQTIVVVTHDEHLAAMADRTITMSDGRILLP